ncbi:hypothetical protein GETHPA_12570 [Geothrix rubra]|uniref:Outer membrane protein beta-barrel domain-containing protein n=1 Tax=Geothrix rubra TaxID=2927977 RepID=A0ABQ5Q5E5_9BACT|nr:outer membrane beta-barrel protein [Geothrix rubra]GLH69724.1 hypothetical protein GETHPA_12570 [Geothrix rubra]
MRKIHHLALGLSTLALSGVSLSAQQYSFGGQVSAAIPTGPLASKDWQDGKPGAGVGVHMVIDLQGGHALVPRLDYTRFKKSESGVDRKVQTYQFGVDYNYFLSGKVNMGPYLGAGIGFGRAKYELTGFGYSSKDTASDAYGAVEGGWMFTRNLGAELRYTWSPYKPEMADFTPRGYTGNPTVNAPGLNASFIFRF